MAKEAHRRLRGEPFAAAKDLQRDFVVLKLNHLGERLLAVRHLDDGDVTQAHVCGPDLRMSPTMAVARV